MTEPYHRFVFDVEHQRFVGEFEQMYAAEDCEGFDSWHQDDDRLSRRLALMVLAGHRFKRVLDFGCGKGAFTARLKRPDNDVLGVDIAPTAIAKAAARYPGCRWMTLGPHGLDDIREDFDLAVAMEVLSYVEDWRAIIEKLATLADRLWIVLYLPPNPIGFVKSFDELREAVEWCATIERDLLIDGEQLCVLARSRITAPAA